MRIHIPIGAPFRTIELDAGDAGFLRRRKWRQIGALTIPSRRQVDFLFRGLGLNSLLGDDFASSVNRTHNLVKELNHDISMIDLYLYEGKFYHRRNHLLRQFMRIIFLPFVYFFEIFHEIRMRPNRFFLWRTDIFSSPSIFFQLVCWFPLLFIDQLSDLFSPFLISFGRIARRFVCTLVPSSF